jgi:hypothetical protein
MAKIVNDKYYTPAELAKHCVDKTKEIVGMDNITEWLEPSGGNGVFLDFLPIGTYSCDIEPEDDRIKKQDYLELDLDYKERRCIIGNPPFGSKNVLAWQFFLKSIELGDYIGFILPISQLNNNQQFYQFDLVYSENLGKQLYSDREIHCCFNIYKRPSEGNRESKINYKLKDIEIKEVRKARNQFLPTDFNYDLGICSWGYVGKQVESEGQYNQEMYIKINSLKHKDKIIDIVLNTNWSEIYPMTTTPRLKQWQVYKYLKEQIPELE